MATNEELKNSLKYTKWMHSDDYFGNIFRIYAMESIKCIGDLLWSVLTCKQKCILLILQDRGVL